MDRENAIEVKNVRKKFRVYYDKGSELKAVIPKQKQIRRPMGA